MFWIIVMLSQTK